MQPKDAYALRISAVIELHTGHVVYTKLKTRGGSAPVTLSPQLLMPSQKSHTSIFCKPVTVRGRVCTRIIDILDAFNVAHGVADSINVLVLWLPNPILRLVRSNCLEMLLVREDWVTPLTKDYIPRPPQAWVDNLINFVKLSRFVSDSTQELTVRNYKLMASHIRRNLGQAAGNDPVSVFKVGVECGAL